jgi:hypothetical protein
VNASLIVCLLCSLAASTNASGTIQIYPSGPKVLHDSPTIISSELRVGDTLYQVFRRRGEPNKELFRVQVGSYVRKELVKWWNYGIEMEQDLNGDGQPDYLWYGGDDTSESIILFISRGAAYERTDIIKTAGAAWKRRFNKTAPDIASVGGEYGVETVGIEKSRTGLTMIIVLKKRFDASNKTVELRITDDRFKS